MGGGGMGGGYGNSGGLNNVYSQSKLMKDGSGGSASKP